MHGAIAFCCMRRAIAFVYMHEAIDLCYMRGPCCFPKLVLGFMISCVFVLFFLQCGIWIGEFVRVCACSLSQFDWVFGLTVFWKFGRYG